MFARRKSKDPSAASSRWWTKAYLQSISACFLIWTGYWVGVTSIQWHATTIPHITAGQIAILYAVQMAPTLLLSPFLGASIDRVGGKRTILCVGLLMGASALTAALLAISGNLNYAGSAIISAALGLCIAVGSPSAHSLIPSTVAPSGLGRAVHLLSIIQNIARLVGPIVSGAFLISAGVSVSLAGIVIIATVGTVLIIRVPKLEFPFEKVETSIWKSMFSGFVAANKIGSVKRSLVLVLLNSSLCLSHVSLLPTLTSKVLLSDEAGYAILVSAGGLGGLLGAFFPMKGMHDLRKMSALFMASSAAMLFLGLAPTVGWATVACFMVTGFGVMTAITLSLYIQRSIDPAVRGRVMSLFTWAWGGFLPIGGLLIGLIADRTSVPLGLISAGVGLLLVAIVNLLVPKAKQEIQTGGRTPPISPDRTQLSATQAE